MAGLEADLIVDLLRQSMDGGNAPFLTVVSGSMAPQIRAGDQVQIAPATGDSLQVGDIIVIKSNKELLTHRFWGVAQIGNRPHLVTKGDRPQHFDQPQDSEALLGRVVGIRRNLTVLKLDQSGGRWLNKMMARIAALDIMLFAKSVGENADCEAIYCHDGYFSSTTRDNVAHLALRRLIKLFAHLVNLLAGFFDEVILDT